MKVVILAGGLGTRLSEETDTRPKPMVEIGGRPIIWHIMKSYAYYGLTDFIICCGYKGNVIKEYFANYFLNENDVTFDFSTNTIDYKNKRNENWKVTLVDTGENTQTGGRLKKVQDHLEKDEDFCFTYGDGLADININELIEFHKNHNKLATISAVRPPARFGSIAFKSNGIGVDKFQEKIEGDGAWISGGYFILNPSVINRIKEDSTVWEEEPLSSLAADNELIAYKHNGFWQPMDTLREKYLLNKLWKNQNAPWRVW